MSARSVRPIDLQTLLQIVAGALTLAERQQYPVSARCPVSPAVVKQLEASSELLALAHRLHPTAASAEDLLFDIDPTQLGPLPAWATPLEALLSTFINDTSTSADCPDAEAMFAGVFAPLLKFADAGLVTAVNRSDSEMSVILSSARHYLQQRLLQLSGRVLATAFQQFKQTASLATHRYQTFIDHLRDGAVIDLLCHYPVLARCWLLEIQNWQRTVERLLQHFSDDREALVAHFPQASTPLVSITFGLSDPHQEGRTVCQFVFENDFTLAYKPRPLAVEVAYSKLMRVLNQMLWQAGSTILPDQTSLDILDRMDHGWVVWITRKPCQSSDEVARYFHRFGQLLAWDQLLGIGDIHPENMVAHGEYPVQVDVEVAFRTHISIPTSVTNRTCAQALLESVLFTNMVPVWTEAMPGIAHDNSGWQLVDGDVMQIPHETWHGAGTDDISLTIERKPASTHHLPMLDGLTMTPATHLDDVLCGMSSVYDALLQGRLNKAVLIDTITQHCQSLPVRFVFRDTSQYTRLLNRLTSPSCHLSGLTRSVAISALAQALHHADNHATSALHQFVSSECLAVQANEVPYFACQSNSTWLDTGSSRIEDIFSDNGLAQAIARVRECSSASARRQTDIVLAAYAGRFNKEVDSAPVAAIALRERRVTDTALDPLTILDRESERIEKLLQEMSLFSAEGSVGWLGVRAVGTTNRLQLHALEAGLYDGLAGIALFLAMRLHRSAGNVQTRQLLQGVLLSLQQQLKTTPCTTGWGSGLGGIAYVLAYIQANCPDAMADQLLNQLPAMTPDYPSEITIAHADLLDGAAGLIAGYSAAWQYTRQPDLLQIAYQWGTRLIGQYEALVCVLDQAHGASLAHGTDGVRVALTRLAHALTVSGDSAAAVRFETVVARLEASINTVTARRGHGSWCHGHAGWLATRDGAQPALLSAVQACRTQPPAQLCCGELGRLDALMVASTSPTDIELLCRRLADLIHQAAQDGFYPFYLQAPQSLLPGLFTGLTGVGYLCERLRQASNGQQSPCVTGII